MDKITREDLRQIEINIPGVTEHETMLFHTWIIRKEYGGSEVPLGLVEDLKGKMHVYDTSYITFTDQPDRPQSH